MTEMLDGIIIGIIVGAVLVGIKVVDYMVNKKDRANGDCGVQKSDFDELYEEIHNVKTVSYENKELNQKLWDLHNRFDEDGMPLWYVPRSWSKAQDKIMDACLEISQTQKSIASTLKAISKKMDE